MPLQASQALCWWKSSRLSAAPPSPCLYCSVSAAGVHFDVSSPRSKFVSACPTAVGAAHVDMMERCSSVVRDEQGCPALPGLYESALLLGGCARNRGGGGRAKGISSTFPTFCPSIQHINIQLSPHGSRTRMVIPTTHITPCRRRACLPAAHAVDNRRW